MFYVGADSTDSTVPICSTLNQPLINQSNNYLPAILDFYNDLLQQCDKKRRPKNGSHN